MHRLAAIILALALLSIACGDDTTSTTDPGDGGDDGADGTGALPLDGREFWSTTVVRDGAEVDLVDGTRITIRFQADGLSADAGCNNLGGSYTIDGDRLVVGDMFMTEMGCDPERHAQDDFVIGFLTAGPRITLDGDHLTLETGTATVTFVSREVADPDRSLHGPTWVVDGFFDEIAATSYATDQPAHFAFDEMRFFGFDGCAGFELTHEFDGETLTIDGAPAGGCGEYSDVFATTIAGGEFTVAIKGARLTLTAPDGRGLTARADGPG